MPVYEIEKSLISVKSSIAWRAQATKNRLTGGKIIVKSLEPAQLRALLEVVGAVLGDCS